MHLFQKILCRVYRFHLGLLVNFDEGPWIVDVGLGDLLFDPIPLSEGTYGQGADRISVAASSVAPGGWRLNHDTHGPFLGVDVAPAPVHRSLAGFQESHRFLSQSPESPWVNRLVVRCRDALNCYSLQGLVFTTRRGSQIQRTVLDSYQSWIELLIDRFHEPLIAYGSGDRVKLFNKVLVGHQRWVDALACSGSHETSEHHGKET